MWTAPVPQEFFQGVIGSLASICPACWCGRGPLAKMVSATRVPNNQAAFLRPMGPTECLAPRIDRSYHLISSCSSGSTGWRASRPADLLSGGCGCSKQPRSVVTLTRRQQLPGDAGNLVGERYRRQLRRLARRPFLACWITAVLPATSTLRSISSPARVILPIRVLPAVE
jgi:hypothetical protein